jgi:hypothetical protein
VLAAGFIQAYRVTALFIPIAIYRILRRSFLRAGEDAHNISSDVSMPPRTLNAFLTGLLSLENKMLPHFSLPFGASVFAVAGKPADTLQENNPGTGNRWDAAPSGILYRGDAT